MVDWRPLGSCHRVHIARASLIRARNKVRQESLLLPRAWKQFWCIRGSCGTWFPSPCPSVDAEFGKTKQTVCIVFSILPSSGYRSLLGILLAEVSPIWLPKILVAISANQGFSFLDRSQQQIPLAYTVSTQRLTSATLSL